MKFLLLFVLLAACDHWPEEHAARCNGWMTRARTSSDSLNVEMTCASIVAAHRAEQMASVAVVTSIAGSK